MLPKEQSHLLPLVEHGPHEQVVEVEGNQQLRVTKAGAQRDLWTAPGGLTLLLDVKIDR